MFGNWYIIKTEKDLVGAVSGDYIEPVYNEEEKYLEENSSKEEQLNDNIEEKANQNLQENTVTQEQNSESINVAESDESEPQTLTEEVIAEEYANDTSLSEEEQEFLDLINANRKANGLEDLQIDEDIQNIARLKAQDLAENNYFSHKSEIYGNIEDMLSTFSVSYNSVGENIAGNSNISKAVEAWMSSENHKINILSEKYNYTGVAVVDSKTYGKIFVQVFVEK